MALAVSSMADIAGLYQGLLCVSPLGKSTFPSRDVCMNVDSPDQSSAMGV